MGASDLLGHPRSGAIRSASLAAQGPIDALAIGTYVPPPPPAGPASRARVMSGSSLKGGSTDRQFVECFSRDPGDMFCTAARWPSALRTVGVCAWSVWHEVEPRCRPRPGGDGAVDRAVAERCDGGALLDSCPADRLPDPIRTPHAHRGGTVRGARSSGSGANPACHEGGERRDQHEDRKLQMDHPAGPAYVAVGGHGHWVDIDGPAPADVADRRSDREEAEGRERCHL